MTRHYVYLLQEIDGDMNYIGCRSCNIPIQDDKYFGSSKYLPYNIHRIARKIILGRFNSRSEALSYEILLHAQFDVANNNSFWNRAKQTSTKFDTTGISYEDHPKGMLGKKHTQEVITKLRVSALGNSYNLGYKHTAQAKLNMSNASKCKGCGDKNTMFRHSSSYTWEHDIFGIFTGRCIDLRDKFHSDKKTSDFVKVSLGKQRSAYGWTIV